MNMTTRQKSAKWGGIFLAASTLLYSASAHAVYTSAVRVDAIEQARATSFAGAAFVRLAGGVRCPFRGDGFFVLPSDGKQQQQIQMLLTALSSGLRVRMNFAPPTCNVETVSICATGSPC